MSSNLLEFYHVSRGIQGDGPHQCSLYSRCTPMPRETLPVFHLVNGYIANCSVNEYFHKRVENHCLRGIETCISWASWTGGVADLWTGSTSWLHWWSPLRRSPRSSSPCASSCDRTSRSSPTAITKDHRCAWVHVRQTDMASDVYYRPVWRFCRPELPRTWSSLECGNLSTCRRGNWPPRLLHGGWQTGRNCSFASILWRPTSRVRPVEDIQWETVRAEVHRDHTDLLHAHTKDICESFIHNHHFIPHLVSLSHPEPLASLGWLSGQNISCAHFFSGIFLATRFILRHPWLIPLKCMKFFFILQSCSLSHFYQGSNDSVIVLSVCYMRRLFCFWVWTLGRKMCLQDNAG